MGREPRPFAASLIAAVLLLLIFIGCGFWAVVELFSRRIDLFLFCSLWGQFLSSVRCSWWHRRLAIQKSKPPCVSKLPDRYPRSVKFGHEAAIYFETAVTGECSYRGRGLFSDERSRRMAEPWYCAYALVFVRSASHGRRMLSSQEPTGRGDHRSLCRRWHPILIGDCTQ